MARYPQVVKLKLRLQPEEPDGTECSFCGDRCYLFQNRLICDAVDQYTQEIIKPNLGKPTDPVYTFCQSCSEVIQEDLI